MSRKDYIAIAEVIKRQKEAQREFQTTADERLHYLALGLCSIFATDNPNFDEARFMQATQV